MDREACKRELGLEGKKVVLYVGRVEPIKGLDLLLQAAAAIEDRRGLRLVMVGGKDGEPEVGRLKQRAQEMGLADAAWFVGSVKQDRLPVFYNAAEALVLPSYYESFGLVALEALACGTPVVASRVGGLPTFVRDGETGYLVPWRSPDAFADRLVNIALADPDGEVAEEIASVFLRSTIGDDHQTPYSGAFDALERLHHGGAGKGTMWLYLVGANPRRGIELGIREWENGYAGLTTRAEGCQFVRHVSRYGSLAVKDGKLVFEPHESVSLDPGSRGHAVERTWEVGAPAQHWSFGEELRQAGFLKTDIDHPCRAVL